MNRVKIITLGTISGLLVSLLSVMLISSLWRLLSGQHAGQATLLVFGLLNGAVIGGASCLLAQITKGLEHRVLIVLVSIAMAAASVLMGNYHSQSLVPLVLYTMALTNGLIVAQVTAVLGQMRSA